MSWSASFSSYSLLDVLYRSARRLTMDGRMVVVRRESDVCAGFGAVVDAGGRMSRRAPLGSLTNLVSSRFTHWALGA